MIHGRLGAELIRVRRIGSFVVLYEDLDVTWHNAIPNDMLLRVSRMTTYK
jgi:hypothetical protein